jgi:peptidoglycan hydrolase CwlO-like protein
MKKQNLQFILKSAISALQVTYKDYKNAIIEDLRCSWYSDDGELAFLAGAEKRKKKIEDLGKEVTRLQFEVDKIKNEIEADKAESEG